MIQFHAVGKQLSGSIIRLVYYDIQFHDIPSDIHSRSVQHDKEPDDTGMSSSTQGAEDFSRVLLRFLGDIGVREGGLGVRQPLQSTKYVDG